MSDSVIDFAALSSAAVTTTETVESPLTATTETVETTDTETAAETTETKEAGKEKTQQYNSDGTPKEDAAAAAKDEELPGTEKTPQEIRQALKALRDSDPKHAAAVKQLHGAFERYEAIKAIFPGGVNEIKQAKA